MENEGKPKSCADYEKDYNNVSLQFREALDDLIIEENCDAVFECKVEGYPPPKCYWYKDGKLLKSNKRTKIIEHKLWHRLEIVSVEPKDHGLYNVICKNESSVITAKAKLYVTKEASDVLYITGKNISNITRHLSDVKVNVGETIHLEATIKTEADTSYLWYKNGKLLHYNINIIRSYNLKNRYSLIIDAAATEDTGIYCIVAKNAYGVESSFASVEVLDILESSGKVTDHSFDRNISNGDDEIIFIEDHLPEEIEANENEDIRLTCVAKIDIDTKVAWFKDKKHLNIYSIPEDYGHSYIGLKIKSPTKSDTGDYSVVLTNEKTGKSDSSNCFVTVNASPIKCPPVINLKKPLQSVVGSYGSKVIFDCIFDHEDLKYFYVVWYVGHYRVERSNTKFSVICKDGHFLLYIKKLEPDMAGQVLCELRRAYSHQKGITINTTTAYLTVVPQVVIDDVKNILEHTRGRIYYGTANVECDAVNYHTMKKEKSNGFSSNIQTGIILDITYCRLEEGYYFLYATRGDNLTFPARVTVHDKQEKGGTSDTIVIEWVEDIPPDSVWYKIEYLENNHYYGIGLSSTATIDVESPPLGKMMQFRIRKICPLEECCEYHVSIAPSLLPKDIPLKNYDLKAVELFEREYTKTGDVIGCGAFGSVTLVKNSVGEYLAAKIVKTRTQKKRDTAMREYEMMKKLRHPKLVELIDAYVAKDMFVFIMDYLWGGELFDRIVNEEHIKEVDVVPYVRQICEALQYMHRNKIAHLDLKPENIICLNPNSGQVKIIDFGLARVLVEGNITRAIYGTKDYVAPEVLNFETLTLACDMWSLGVVTYMLLSGVMPFAGESWPERSANIIMANYNYDDTAFSEISELAKDFVDQLLVLEANKRMSADMALKHKWIIEGPPKGIRAGHMKRARENLKSYLANYRARWQRAGNVMIAALRLRTHANTLRGVAPQSVAPCAT